MNKNVYLIATDKPSRLHLGNSGLVLCDLNFNKNTINSRNIFITSDEEIKEGDWYYDFNLNKIKKALEVESDRIYYTRYHCTIPSKAKKIILTTDSDLIAEGVQAIDDEFLEWFVKNPSCEYVNIKPFCKKLTCKNKECNVCCQELNYKIIIPKEEPNFGNSLDTILSTICLAGDLFSKGEGIIDKIEQEQFLKEIMKENENLGLYNKENLEKEMFELEQELDIPANLRFHNSKGTLHTKLYTLVEIWQDRQHFYENLAFKYKDDEHNNRKCTYKAMAIRDCWKELIKILENEK